MDSNDLELLKWFWLAGCVMGAMFCACNYLYWYNKVGKFPRIDFTEVLCIIGVMVLWWPGMVILGAAYLIYLYKK